jgi:hypothetical protein
MPMEFIVPSLHIVALGEITYLSAIEKRISELVELEEDRFVVGFHQHIHTEHEKAWHDRHIKKKKLHKGDLFLLYHSKFLQHPKKFQMY